MFDFFAFDPTSLASLVGENKILAGFGAFAWGLGSALLSPCHLGIIPLLGAHAAGYGPFAQDGTHTENPVRHTVLFTLGCFLTMPFYGVLLSLLGHGLELGGHFWTVPVGLVLLWLAWDMNRTHACSHIPHILEKLRMRLGLTLTSGIFALGFGYGLFAGGCTIGFLLPLLAPLLGSPLSMGLMLCLFLATCFGLGHCLPMLVVGCSAPLAKRLLHARHAACHGTLATPHHNEHDHTHIREPHSGEALFRRLLSIVIFLIGIAFVLHPFLEND